MAEELTDSQGAAVPDEVVLASTGKRWSDWFGALDADGARDHVHDRLARHLAQDHGLNPWWSQLVATEYEVYRGTHQRAPADGGHTADAERTIAAPCQGVWAALARPSGWASWFTSWAVFGPGVDEDPALVAAMSPSDAYTSDAERNDPGVPAQARPRPKGRTAGHQAAVGDAYLTADGDRGRFVTVDELRTLAFTWEHRKHTPSLVTMTLVPTDDGGTWVRLAHSGLRSAEEAANLRDGWAWALGELAKHVEA